MKLSPRDAPAYFAKPDPSKTGLLIYGQDAMRVALKRQEVIAALVGPAGEDEMRLTRLGAADVRKDPALLIDALKAQSFFPGPRVVHLEDTTDALAKTVETAVVDWQDGDAQLVVTAGSLNARSALRKLFEGHPNAYAAAIYDDPPSRTEIEAMLAKAGVGDLARDAEAALVGWASALDPGDFRQLVEKLALYMLSSNEAATVDDVAAVAPLSTEAKLDDILNTVAEARAGEIGPLIRRLEAQGVQPVGLCIGATRHFRALHRAAADPGGASKGIGKLRPPVFGPRRDRMVRQAQNWGMRRLEMALRMLTDTDLQLRSASRAPAMAVMERTLVRLAMLGAR